MARTIALFELSAIEFGVVIKRRATNVAKRVRIEKLKDKNKTKKSQIISIITYLAQTFTCDTKDPKLVIM